ncbi:MAG: EAL domain-containing protein [Rhodoferax sp.]|uniref:EAL domain-containing protein n=1 Tax=Rhodoferax sp. TaxID=50421 RepID=UPI00260E996A|nr:EAL domain-containing protein [Rhodoferax sp.]MDD2880134.1 EAL domain-containing protein [Rhodoferax sp.]
MLPLSFLFKHIRWRALLRCVPLWLATSALHATMVIPAESAPKQVRVGVYANAPKIFLSNDGRLSGIFGDLLMAMAERERWQILPVPCEWQACLHALQNGQIDLMPDVAQTDERAKIFDFHQTPALLSWSQVYKNRGAAISTIPDLNGKRIAVVTGSVQAEFLQTLLTSFAVKAQVVQVDSFEQGFERVANGSLDAVAANRFFGDLQAPTYRLEPTAIVFQPAQLFYATAKGRHPELLATIDQYLKLWQAQSDSPYRAALQRWMQAPTQFIMPNYVWWWLAGLLGVLALALMAAFWLRRQVAQKTAHLRDSEERLSTILNSVDAYIYIKDPQLRYQYANSKVCELFGRPLDQVIGLTDSTFFNADTVKKLRTNDLRVIEHGERVEEEEINRSADGHIEHSYVSVKLPLRDADGRIYALCGISTDISKRKQAEDAIHQLAFYDPLTGLPNRRLLQDRVQQLLGTLARTPHGAALMFIDVDNFKDINDTLGHDMGDTLLCQMAQRMSECIRAQDTLARQGGDEFVVMLIDLAEQPEEAANEAQRVAQKILICLNEPYTLGNRQYQGSVSIGVALVDAKAPSREELFKQADLAMYQAKAAGRNTLRFFNPAMQAQVMARTSLEADLHWALQHEEFVLFYQPQVDAQGQTLGHEALVRWQHPMRGLVLPGDFIAAAESCGVILPLGRWILNTACEQLVVWAGQALQGQWTIAVNVSARQFRQADFVAQLQAVLAQTGANATRLELELTESQLLDDVPSVIAKMDALRALGVRLSLDDFGTGYSSLAMLKRLPLNQLKIDRAFVRDMLADPQDAAIIRAIVTMGESLSLDVIAEGVELVAQRDALLALGCHHFQGYLFGRPAPLVPTEHQG